MCVTYHDRRICDVLRRDRNDVILVSDAMVSALFVAFDVFGINRVCTEEKVNENL